MKTMSSTTSTAVGEKIIEIVSRNPCLYDHYDPDYNNKRVTDVIWDQAGDTVNLTGTKSKTLWKNFKDSYRVQKKKFILAKKKGYKIHPDKKWHFYDMMSFVDRFIDCSSVEHLPPDDIELGSCFIKDDEITQETPKIVVTSGSDSLPNLRSSRKRKDPDPDYSPDAHVIKKELSRPRIIIPSARTPSTASATRMPSVKQVKIVRSSSQDKDGTKDSHSDPEATYGAHVAAMLRTFNPRQKQLAKMRIEQIFYDVQFPDDGTVQTNNDNIPTGLFSNMKYVTEMNDDQGSPQSDNSEVF